GERQLAAAVDPVRRQPIDLTRDRRANTGGSSVRQLLNTRGKVNTDGVQSRPSGGLIGPWPKARKMMSRPPGGYGLLDPRQVSPGLGENPVTRTSITSIARGIAR